MGRNRTYHLELLTAFELEHSVLVAIPVEYIPATIAAIEKYKQPSQWIDFENFSLGYQSICKTQWGLLMDVGDRLIMEIRALRGAPIITADMLDPEQDPFLLPLATVQTSNEKLEAIRLLIEAMEASETLEEIKASAAQIAILLA